MILVFFTICPNALHYLLAKNQSQVSAQPEQESTSSALGRNSLDAKGIAGSGS